jgi:TusA-related sulfurtransferase
MSLSNIGTSAVVALVVAVLVAGVFGGTETIREIREVAVGGAAGPEHLQHQVFKQNFTRGGTTVATSSTAAAYTLTTAELRENVGYLSWTVNVNTTLTTMASTSRPLAGLKPGEAIEVLFYNASTTANATATFAAGTGVDLQEDEGGSVVVNGLEAAKLTFIKKADSDVIFLVEPYQVGD